MIAHFLNPPNWFTAASIFCSVTALSMLVGPGGSAAETLARASVLVIFGGIFDMMDGRVARLTKRESAFGVQLDSIADIVGFGVAPALLAYAWVLHELGTVGAFVAFWYTLCAAFRLARYNVNTETREWPLKGHSQGLTSTMAGGVLVSTVWVFSDFLVEVTPPAWFVAIGVVVLGLLMVSAIPFRNFRDLRQNKVARRLLALSLACCLVGGVVHPSLWWGIGAALYVTVGFADGIFVAFHHRRLGQALMFDDDLDPPAEEEIEIPLETL